MKSKKFKFILRAVLFIIALFVGVPGGVMMAEDVATAAANASELAGGGEQVAGDHGDLAGVATETGGQIMNPDNLYTKHIDEIITRIRPNRTPIDQISRKAARVVKTDSAIVKYYSAGTRPLSTSLTTAVALQTTEATVSLNVANTNMFTEDDTIICVGVKGYLEDGVTLSSHDLELCVLKRDDSGFPVVYAVNGKMGTSTNQTTVIPAIPANTVLVRAAKACAESDIQTGTFTTVPTADEQYVQNFMTQVSQTTFDKMASKEVNWNFSDLEDDAIFDMKRSMEVSYLMGTKRKIKHNLKKTQQYFTGGIFWQAGRDVQIGTPDTLQFTVGHASTAAGNVTVVLNGIPYTIAIGTGKSTSDVAALIAATTFSGWSATANANVVTFIRSSVGAYSTPTFTDTGTTGVTGAFTVSNVAIDVDQLVDFTKSVFVGNDSSDKKILLCGSEMLAAFEKIKGDKYQITKSSIENWDLTFKSFRTGFGEVLVIYHDLFDQLGRSNQGLVLDADYLVKAIRFEWRRFALDLKAAGVSNTDDVVLQEVSALYLRYPDAHARASLAA
jgi:hypothetical protein